MSTNSIAVVTGAGSGIGKSIAESFAAQGTTVIAADQIVVLDHGRVDAVGTHDDLLESSRLYRELAEHQLLVPVD